jgi:UPF0716 family protein affecting phage T7 exclusion
MEHASALSVWESFYVIVGSSGGALIGLQFVVAVAALGLLLIRIHNAWDTVVHIVLWSARDDDETAT